MKHSLLRSYLFILLMALSLLRAITPARADGLLFSNGVFRQPLESHINVTIKNKIATTSLEQTFQNTLDKEVSAVYIAPVPAGATVIGFAEQINGEWRDATIQTSEEARAQFDSAVSKGQDAAMAAAVVSDPPPGMDPKTTFQTRISLPAKSTRSVRLIYTEVLAGDVGLTRYNYPLSNTNWTDEPIGDLLVKVNIIENSEIRALYSPSQTDQIEITRPDKTDAEVVYHMQNFVPSQNFELVYTQSNDKFGVNLASYREADDQDGYFVLVASPQLEAKKDEVIQKDFVFVLDCSGSMSGQKAIQAKTALNKILDALNPGDRFAVITFSSGVTAYSTDLLAADFAERDKAKDWVLNFPVNGGTNINEALLTALGTVDKTSNRPHIVVFLTDGQATDGVTATSAILANIKEAIRPQSRLYTIGVGDVNQALLDSLAQTNRGTSLMVSATEGLEQRLDNFYAAIDSPVLVDLALDFGGMAVYDVQPNPIPDMFLGGQVVVTGRYKGGGPTTISLNGNINGEQHTSTYKDIQFIKNTADAKAYSYVPRLWAQRKVDALVRKLSIDGPDTDTVNQVKELGLRYNIVTPYTSFVVTSKDPAQPTAVAMNATPPIVRQPGLPKTGLPFLYVDDYRTVNTVLMIAGAVLSLLGLIVWAVRTYRGRHVQA
ncbi:MAG: VWA domain-containing protein [Chloroflexota bacterium]